MKIKIASVVVFALVVAAAQLAHAQQHDFERSPNYQKLDGRARMAWVNAMRAGDKKRELSCLIKVRERLNQKQKNRLTGAGFKPGTIIQTIVTGRIAAEKVPSLAGLDFVKVVELAVPLDIKRDPGYQKYGVPRRRAVPRKAAKKEVKKEEPKAVTEKKAEPEGAPALKPVQTGEVSVEVPIYETPRPAETYPNRPPTSNEIPSEESAIAPVDQATVPIGTKPTLTQPIVGTSPAGVEVEVKGEPRAAPPEKKTIYAPEPSGP
jgi:hypothetical protein